MRAVRSLLTILAACSRERCQSPRQTFERTFLPDPTKPYIGMTKEQIIACAGKPTGQLRHHSGATLAYHYSGAGPVPRRRRRRRTSRSKPARSGSRNDKDWKCNASLVFESGRLARVTFAPRHAVSPYGTRSDPKTRERVAGRAAGALHFLAAELPRRLIRPSLRQVADRLDIVAVGIEHEGPVIIGVVIRA